MRFENRIENQSEYKWTEWMLLSHYNYYGDVGFDEHVLLPFICKNNVYS